MPSLPSHLSLICPRCEGKGTVVKDGPHHDEYDSQYPCPDCTKDRTALRGTGYRGGMECYSTAADPTGERLLPVHPSERPR